MSNQNYYLVSIIIFIISKMDLNKQAYLYLFSETFNFFSVVSSFINEFAMKKISENELAKDNCHFTNIIYYMFGFIDDHFDHVHEKIKLENLFSWVRMYIVDKGIIQVWLNIVEKFIMKRVVELSIETEDQIVALLLHIILVFSEQSISGVRLQVTVLNLLTELFCNHSSRFIRLFI